MFLCVGEIEEKKEGVFGLLVLLCGGERVVVEKVSLWFCVNKVP